MIHEKYDVEGEMVVHFSAEDWVWWCEFLKEVRDNDEADEYDRADLDCILRALGNAEQAVYGH